MVFYQIEWARLLPIFIAQPLSAILFIGLAIKILIRKRDQVSISLAIFYVISSLSIIFNAVFVLLTTIDAEILLLYLFYFLTAYFIVFSPFFILLFLDLLLSTNLIVNSHNYYD